MRILKITIAMLLAITMLFSLCACGFNLPDVVSDALNEANDINVNDSKDNSETNVNDAVDNSDKNVNDSVNNGANNNSKFKETTIKLDECEIVVLGAEKIVDTDEKPALRIWFDVTNTSDETEDPSWFYDFSATQDGYELVDIYTCFEDEVPESSIDHINIRPTATIRLVKEISFKEDGGIVKASFYDYETEENPYIVEFDPANLPGAPKDELVIKKVSDPKWMKNVKPEGVYKSFDEEYEIKIEDYEVTEDYLSDKIIRVYYTFKNTSSKKTSFGSAVYIDAFQDGIELDLASSKEQIKEDKNDRKKIRPGKSIKVSRCYRLISDSPVEIDARDYYDGNVGAIFEVK